ncbi:MAG: hypothetical protein ACI3XL_06690 [Eubacteriales bacterium]
MAYTPRNPKKPNNAYKTGKLSRAKSFSRKKFNPVPLIVLACVLASFIGAVILGSYLGDKAEQSQNTTTTPGGASSLNPPAPDKTDPRVDLNAFLADMTGADPEESLSAQTGVARERGNALFIPLRDTDGKLIYSSDKTDELGYPARSNLTLERLNNHFDYYVDFAVGYLRSDFSPSITPAERLKIQSDEIILLSEATEEAFGQIIVSFNGEINKDNLIYYQAYLVDLKLACPEIPVGIELSYDFVISSDNSGTLAELLSIADFYAIDLGAAGAEALEGVLSGMVYLNERYGCVVLLSDCEDIAERIAKLTDKKINNFVVK